jgi:hypothetical protein
LTLIRAFVPIRAVKSITPFLLLIAIALSACETSVNRRSLYAPAKASGPYTQALKTGSWRRGEYPMPKAEAKKEDATKRPDVTEPVPAL